MPLPDYVKYMRERIGSDLLVMVGAAAIIVNDAGEVLLQLRSDTHTWGPPGGALEPGEEPADAVIREVFEETGLVVMPERLVGIYGGPDMVFTYPNGDKTAITSITFACRVVGGALQADGEESLDLRWFAFDELPDDIAPWIRQRIVHALTLDTPYFYLPGDPRPL
jgi:8-oxo-dGTP diphosphatase